MRKILIIPPDGKVEDFLQMANDNGVAEIAQGIPSALSHLYADADLPVVYTEEIQVSEPAPLEILQADNQALQDRLAQAERVNSDNSQTSQDLLEALIEAGVI